LTVDVDFIDFIDWFLPLVVVDSSIFDFL
jgi:hypothetical protein